MQNTKWTILIAILFCVILDSVYSTGTARNKAKPKKPTAFELLDKFVETQDQFQSFRVKVTTLRRGFSSRRA